MNVSLEIEEVVFKEAFGGQVASTKTAYSLIYINEFCKNQLESKTVAPFLMGKFMNVNSDLRNQITMDNNAFRQQYERFIASRTADAIRRRFQDKKRQVHDSKQTLESMLHLPLVNIIFHLNFEKKTVFCEWIMLNQAVYDELGVEAGGLRALADDKNNLVYRELETSFKPGFLSMS